MGLFSRKPKNTPPSTPPVTPVSSAPESPKDRAQDSSRRPLGTGAYARELMKLNKGNGPVIMPTGEEFVNDKSPAQIREAYAQIKQGDDERKFSGDVENWLKDQ